MAKVEDDEGIMDENYEEFEPFYQNANRENVYENTTCKRGSPGNESIKPKVPPKPKSLTDAKGETQEESLALKSPPTIISDDEYNDIEDEDEEEREEQNVSKFSRESSKSHHHQDNNNTPVDISLPIPMSMDDHKTSSKMKGRRCSRVKRWIPWIISVLATVIAVGCVCAVLYMVFKVCVWKGTISQTFQLISEEKNNLDRLYITPQGENTTVTLRMNSNSNYSANYMQTILFERKVSTATTAIWDNKLIRGRADAVTLESTSKISLVMQRENHDTFSVLPDSLTGYNYTLVFVPYTTDSIKCSHTAHVYCDHNCSKTLLGHKGKYQDKKTVAILNENATYSLTSPAPVLSIFECNIGGLIHRMYEQVIPNEHQGKEYYIPDFSIGESHCEAEIRVVSLEEGNQISRIFGENKQPKTATVGKGAIIKDKETPVKVVCTKSCSVSAVIKCNSNGEVQLSFTNIIPINSYLHDTVYFSADMDIDTWPSVAVIIVVCQGKHKNIKFDGKIVDTWTDRLSLGFSYVSIPVSVDSRATHVINSQEVPFMAYLIGTGKQGSAFAHPIHMKTEN